MASYKVSGDKDNEGMKCTYKSDEIHSTHSGQLLLNGNVYNNLEGPRHLNEHTSSVQKFIIREFTLDDALALENSQPQQETCIESRTLKTDGIKKQLQTARKSFPQASQNGLILDVSKLSNNKLTISCAPKKRKKEKSTCKSVKLRKLSSTDEEDEEIHTGEMNKTKKLKFEKNEGRSAEKHHRAKDTHTFTIETKAQEIRKAEGGESCGTDAHRAKHTCLHRSCTFLRNCNCSAGKKKVKSGIAKKKLKFEKNKGRSAEKHHRAKDSLKCKKVSKAQETLKAEAGESHRTKAHRAKYTCLHRSCPFLRICKCSTGKKKVKSGIAKKPLKFEKNKGRSAKKHHRAKDGLKCKKVSKAQETLKAEEGESHGTKAHRAKYMCLHRSCPFLRICKCSTGKKKVKSGIAKKTLKFEKNEGRSAEKHDRAKDSLKCKKVSKAQETRKAEVGESHGTKARRAKHMRLHKSCPFPRNCNCSTGGKKVKSGIAVNKCQIKTCASVCDQPTNDKNAPGVIFVKEVKKKSYEDKHGVEHCCSCDKMAVMYYCYFCTKRYCCSDACSADHRRTCEGPGYLQLLD